MEFNLEIALTICSIVVTAAIPFIVVVWQNRKQKVKFVESIKVCEMFTNEVIPCYIDFKHFFDNSEFAFLNEISVNENNTELLIPFKVDSYEMNKCLELDESNLLLNHAMLLFNKLDLFAAFVLVLCETDRLYAKTNSRNAFVDIINKFSGLYDIIMFEHENDYISLRHLYTLWK